MKNLQLATESTRAARFGQRRVRPRALVSHAKHHIRTFLSRALEELGFVSCECTEIDQLGALLDAEVPDLVLFGLLNDGVETCQMLNLLGTKQFKGKILLLGPRACPMVKAVHQAGDQFGLAMLPVLATPFGEDNLRESVASLLPNEPPPNPAIDVAQALCAGWIELWYQPLIEARTLNVSGAEALIRIRHPNWGIVPPAYFIPDNSDPHFRALSEFVMHQAIEDWHYFVAELGHLQLAINLPISFLQVEENIERLCLQMPNHPAFEGLMIEINGIDAVRNLELVQEIAKKLRFHKIGISIDDLGAEWPLLMDIHDFPFLEVKLDRKFVTGCANDRLKQMVCREILDLVDLYGSRTVAEGVESRADFFAVREMGIDCVQGFLFGKPMMRNKFATVRTRPMTLLGEG
jgi:EAL domain-containing protein (putative c-di-GMP-specific phosphodiesterase class I)